MAKSEEHIRLSLKWVVGLLIGAITGTFVLTKYAGRESNSALKTSLETATLRAEKAEKELDRIKRGQPLSSPPEIVEWLPNVTLDAAQNPERAKQLAEKLSHVENERDEYLQQLLQNTVSSLDPKSELHILLEQLSSDDPEIQENAINGLFALKEPASFAPLADFFKKNLTSGYDGGHALYEWYELFLDIDSSAAIELLVNDMGNQDRHRADAANFILGLQIKSVELIDACKPHLESLALRSPDSTARARAKAMLVEFSKRRAVLIEDEKEAGKDSRGRTEILLNIEKLVKQLVPCESSKPEQFAPADAAPSSDQD